MFNTPILDIILGLVFIFLLYSLLATSVKEAIASLLGLRARMLKKGIVQAMFSDTPDHFRLYSLLKGILDYLKEFLFFFTGRLGEKKGLGYHFYKHPLMKNYGSNKLFSHPSYISAQNFSMVLIETLKWDFVRKLDSIVNITYDSKSGLSPEEYRSQLLNSSDAMQLKVLLAFYLAYYKQKELKPKPAKNSLEKMQDKMLGVQRLENQAETMKNMQRVEAPNRILELMDEPIIDQETIEILQLHLTKSIYNIDAFGLRMEGWFNDTMDRVSGWYKRQVQVILLIIGFVIAFVFNVDVIDIAVKLSKDDKLRDKLVQSAVAYSKAHPELPGGDTTGMTKEQKQKIVVKDTAADNAYRKEVKDKFKQVDSMIDHDIHDVNTLLALGYGDYGRTNAEFRKELENKTWWCVVPFHWTKSVYAANRKEGINQKAFLKDSLRYEKDPVFRKKDSLHHADWLKWAKVDIRDKVLLAQLRGLYKFRTDSLMKVDSVLKAGTVIGRARPLAKDSTVKISRLVSIDYDVLFQPVLDSVLNERFYRKELDRYPIQVKTAYMWFTLVNARRKWLGFLLLGLAVSLGAPFWFDLLNKIVNLRSTGKKEGGTGGDGSKGDVKTDGAAAGGGGASTGAPMVINVNNKPGEEEAVG